MAGENKTIGGGGLHHVAIRVTNFDRTIQFYCDVLGFQKRVGWGDQPQRAALLDTGDGNYLEVFERPDQPTDASQGVYMHFALRTDNVDAALELARSAGAKVTMEPTDITIEGDKDNIPIRIAFFNGPDGESIELFQNEKT